MKKLCIVSVLLFLLAISVAAEIRVDVVEKVVDRTPALVHHVEIIIVEVCCTTPPVLPALPLIRDRNGNGVPNEAADLVAWLLDEKQEVWVILWFDFDKSGKVTIEDFFLFLEEQEKFNPNILLPPDRDDLIKFVLGSFFGKEEFTIEDVFTIEDEIALVRTSKAPSRSPKKLAMTWGRIRSPK